MHKNLAIGDTTAYHTYPDDGETHPGLILIEEIWGLNDNIRSIADRFAAEGYSVLAPELLPQEMVAELTPELRESLFDPEKRNEAQPKLRAMMAPIMQPEYAEGALEKLTACVDYLAADPGVNGKIAVLGFCFGGSYSFHLAAHDSRIKAAVPFYGQAPSEEEAARISCPVLAFYGDQDTALIESLPKLKEAMQSHGKEFETVVYPGAGHAFFNDTNARMFRPAEAQDAWQRSLAFLSERLA